MIESSVLANLAARVEALEQRHMKAVADLLYSDPHSWSKRPCGTCKSISAIVGFKFGCYRYMESGKHWSAGG